MDYSRPHIFRAAGGTRRAASGRRLAGTVLGRPTASRPPPGSGKLRPAGGQQAASGRPALAPAAGQAALRVYLLAEVKCKRLAAISLFLENQIRHYSMLLWPILPYQPRIYDTPSYFAETGAVKKRSYFPPPHRKRTLNALRIFEHPSPSLGEKRPAPPTTYNVH